MVAANFRTATHDLLNRLPIAGTCHARLFEFAAFAALEGFFEIIHGCCNGLRRTLPVSVCSATGPNYRTSRRAALILILRTSAGRTNWARVAPANNLHQVEVPRRVF